MKKNQIKSYQRRCNRVKKLKSKYNVAQNSNFNRLLSAAENSLYKLNEKSLADETRRLLKNQLDLLLKTLEANLR